MKDTSDLTFFLGAGASAPFGIPTMKKLVIDYEKMLIKNGKKEELEVFSDIKSTLENIKQRSVDLEDVFTVVDGILNYGIDRIGLLAAYSSMKQFSDIPAPSINLKILKQLQKKFENFIRNECMIPIESYSEILTVYKDLFNKICEFPSHRTNVLFSRDIGYCTSWNIFTTNYDTSLEYFWRDGVNVRLDTGFRYDETRGISILDPRKLLIDGTNILRLIKLHGSLNWLIEPDGTITEKEALQSKSFLGRKYEGPMMIYPIQQKELYVEPFISMFLRLNNELRLKKNWIIIGYSFNDPIIREIFIKNSDDDKNIIFLHPHANKIINEHLSHLRGNIFPITKYFGRKIDYQNVNQIIIDNLISNT